MTSSQIAHHTIAITASWMLVFAPGGCIHAQSPSKNMKITEDVNKWKVFRMPEYALEFRYPPEAVVDDSVAVIGGVWTIDGLRRSPYSIKLMPEYSPELIDGVFHNFVVRFIMLTDAAELDPMWAKKYGWKERPSTAFVPFDFDQHKDGLRTAIEQLYMMREQAWLQIVPVEVDEKPGIHMACWRPKGEPRREQHFEEIVAVPVSKDRILLVHGGYFHLRGDSDLKGRQELFARIAQSVRFKR